MKLNEYQDKAMETAIYPEKTGLAYVAMGLAGEAGEVANKVKKIYRDCDGVAFRDDEDQIAKELGDVLWYVATMAHEIGYRLEDIAQMNVEKLASRKERGAIKGSGDDR